MMLELEAIIRFIAAILVGLAIGFTRRHKPAGPRTFALFCLGCTIFTVISLNFSDVNNDQTRILGQIVTGIGFLGLGVIWRQGIGKPTGLTTAAGIWVTAALGMLIGLGMWEEAIVGTVLTVGLLFSKKTLVRAKIEQHD